MNGGGGRRGGRDGNNWLGGETDLSAESRLEERGQGFERDEDPVGGDLGGSE